MLDILICIGLTHGYRIFVLRKNWHLLYPRQLIKKIIPAVLVLAVLYMATVLVKNYFAKQCFHPHFTDTFQEYYRVNWLPVLVTGARLMSIWVLAWHLYLYAQREIIAVKENARLSIIAKEANLSKLSAQLNPHFLFNSLNNIKALVVDNPIAARRSIDLLSDLLRTSLYSKEDKFVSIREELDLVKDYLELEKLRFEERLLIKLDAPESTLALPIPPLSIQVLVENAIKHGIDKRKEGGLIEVKIEQKDHGLIIIVSNPGKLLHTNQTAGLGLKNLQERLQLQFNGKAMLNIAQRDHTVTATIFIPWHGKN